MPRIFLLAIAFVTLFLCLHCSKQSAEQNNQTQQTPPLNSALFLTASGSLPQAPPSRKTNHSFSEVAVSFDWAQAISGLQGESAYDIAISPTGEVAVTGYFEGELTIPMSALSRSSGQKNSPGTPTKTSYVAKKKDAFVALYSPGGVLQWFRSFGGPRDDAGRGITMDSVGNIYCTGHFAGLVPSWQLTSRGVDDVFIMKINKQGETIWVRKIGGKTNDQGLGIAVDSEGNGIVVGEFTGEVKAGTSLWKSNGLEDGFVAYFDKNGQLTNSLTFGGREKDRITQVRYASAGAVIAGEFSDTVTLADSKLESTGNTDIFVARLNKAGAIHWTRNFGGAFADVLRGLAVDTTDAIVIAGAFDDTIDFSGHRLSAKGKSDGYVAKLSYSGNPMWAWSFGSKESDFAYDVDIDASGTIWTTGWFWQSIRVGNNVHTAKGNTDILFVGIHPLGGLLFGVLLMATKITIKAGLSLRLPLGLSPLVYGVTT